MYIERVEIKQYTRLWVLVPAIIIMGIVALLLYASSDYVLFHSEHKREYLVALDLRENGHEKINRIQRYNELKQEADKVISLREDLHKNDIMDYEAWLKFCDDISIGVIDNAEELMLFEKEFYYFYGFKYDEVVSDILDYYPTSGSVKEIFIKLYTYEKENIQYMLEHGENFDVNQFELPIYWNEKYNTTISGGEDSILPYMPVYYTQRLFYISSVTLVVFVSFCILMVNSGNNRKYIVPYTSKLGLRVMDRSMKTTIILTLSVTALTLLVAFAFLPYKVLPFINGRMNSLFCAQYVPKWIANFPFGIFLMLQVIILSIIVISATLLTFSIARMLKSRLLSLLIWLGISVFYYFTCSYIFFDCVNVMDGSNETFIASFTVAHPTGIEFILACCIMLISVGVYYAIRKRFKKRIV